MSDKVGILFVCLGNICRSPAAHGVFETLAERSGLADTLQVDSCGTGSWHIGQPPDVRMQQAAMQRGYDLSHLRARRLAHSDFDRFEYILAMDTRNLADVMKQAPDEYQGQIRLLLDYADEKNLLEVPDPYYGGDEGFERVLTLVESACEGLIETIRQRHG